MERGGRRRGSLKHTKKAGDASEKPPHAITIIFFFSACWLAGWLAGLL